MSKVLAIAEHLLMQSVMSGNFPVSRKTKEGYGLMALAGLLSLVAAGFLIQGFHLWVQARFAPEIAALVTGGAILALALAVGLGALNILHHRKLRARHARNDLTANLKVAIDMIDGELGDKIRENPQTSVILASVAGFILADKIL